MPVRSRLLDMGEVGAVRAHSLRYALAERLGPDDGAALLLVRSVSPAIVLGEHSAVAAAAVDPAACRARRVPVLRLPAAGAATPIGAGSLLVSLLVPRARAGELGLPAGPAERRAWLADLAGAAAGRGVVGEPVVLEVAEIESAVALTVVLSFGRDAELDGLVMGVPAGAPERHGPVASVSPAEVAEALLLTLEQRTGVDLVPSMPMPDELDSVYDWDRKLAATAGMEATTPEPELAV